MSKRNILLALQEINRTCDFHFLAYSILSKNLTIWNLVIFTAANIGLNVNDIYCDKL